MMKKPDPNLIIKFLESPKYKPLRSRDLANKMGVPVEQRSAFKKVLMRLVQSGKVKRAAGGRYVAAFKESAQRKAKKKQKPAPELGKLNKLVGKLNRVGKSMRVRTRIPDLPEINIINPEFRGLENGYQVVVELVSKGSTGPNTHSGPQSRLKGKVIEVLGKAGDINVEKKCLFIEYGLPAKFPSKVYRDKLDPQISEEEISKREDFRSMRFVTIDNDTARDFDDAVAIERRGGGYRLWVSIADVSHYVKQGSPIDQEAQHRSTSVYLPDQVVPMLYEKLSNWLCSLVPDEDRLTKTVEIDFDDKGQTKDFKVYNTVIRSKARLTYTQVSDVLTGVTPAQAVDDRITLDLQIMEELYKKLKSKRVESGELDFDFPEAELIQDELGRTVDIIKSERSISHGLIEEFMIAANSAVGEFIFHSERPSVYRVHEPPDSDSIAELSADLSKLGYKLKIGGKVKAEHLQKIIYESSERGEQLVVHTMILRSLTRAVYTTAQMGHFGLAIKHYTHFTSPIRRYPDLIVHRVINSLIYEEPPPYDLETLNMICTTASYQERYADQVEREGINLERVGMMKSHLGDEFSGFVLSVHPFGIFVELDEYFVEGLVPREKIRPRRQQFNVGQSVRVRLIETDLEKRRLTFEMVKSG